MLVIVTNKYHDYGCCESTRGADNLLGQYEQDMMMVINHMIKNPDHLITTIWKKGSLLAIDNSCECRMGQGEIRSKSACAQCSNLRRLINFNKTFEPFQIQCGQFVGKTMVISKIPVLSPFLSWDKESPIRAGKYFQQYQNVHSCGVPKFKNIRCVTGDPFTTRTLIMWMLHYIFSEKQLPHIPKLRTAFICDNVGYSLYDFPTIGNIKDLENNLSPKIVKDIIVQLLVIFTELSYVNFSHGNPGAQALLFFLEPISYKYNDYHVESAITVQLANMWNSSATFNNVHYYPKNLESALHIEKNLFAPEIITKVCGSNFYRLTTSTINIYSAMRHIGFPLYIGSLDFYCFMVSLMCNKNFYYYVMTTNLRDLWLSLWLQEDINNITSRITEEHKKEIQCSSVDMIKGLWLRCDVIKFMWDTIRKF